MPSFFNLQCLNLTKKFGGRTVIDNLSFSANKGEFVTLLGPSGCGKSVLLRMLAGFETPDEGQILIEGEDMSQVPPFKRKTAICVQNFALFPNLNVQKNVEFGLENQGFDKEERFRKSLHWIEVVGLKGFENRKIDQLSGGQKQRVALARALAIEPEILLLDEPLGALDANLRVRMQSEIKGLQQNLGITIIHVTGSESEAMAMADRIIMLNEGRIEQEGPPKEIFRHPKTKFVASFMGNYNLIQGKVASTNGQTVLLDSEVGTITVDRMNLIEPVSPGTAATAIFRTDHATLLPANSTHDFDNSVVGNVHGVEFKGSIVEFVIELENKQILKIEKHQSRNLQIRNDFVGKAILGWNGTDTQLLTQ